MMIKRTLSIPKNNSFFLFGPRQTGKSTLLKAEFSSDSVIYYDLLKFDEYSRLLSRPSVFREEVLARNKDQKYIIVDEIQRIPELLDEIHFLLESPEAPIFCLSGSSARKLKRVHANLLAGRAWTRRLYPLTHKECGDLFSLEKAMRIGTLPSVYLSQDEEGAKETLKAYVETYLKEEIEAEAVVRNLSGFLRFLPLAASENSNIINYSNIARETGVSYKTVKEYFQILQDTLIGFFLMPYTKSAREQLIKHPKFYFFDTGVQRALERKLSLIPQRGTSDFGKCFEHFFITEILRLIDYARKDYQVSFYRTRSGAEVDLIIQTPQKQTYAIEIKASDTPDPRQLSGLKSFRDMCPQAALFCACLAMRPRVCNGITILPWQDIFMHLDI